MVAETIAGRGITDPRVLEAMLLVPRHELVPYDVRDQAYDDRPLPIGFGLTISQPFIVAVMTEAASVQPGERVLEIGTGSGYQAAVLHAMGAEVYTIEIEDALARRTGEVLAQLGFDEIRLKTGDGYFGWPDAAPFDAIVVTAAAPEVPRPLLDQLAPGGRMVLPLGDDFAQQLVVVTRAPDGTTTEQILFEVRFGPMTGEIRRAH
jgi:protein-L-isoaspartate(D-aspartate) O-methyltransferase